MRRVRTAGSTSVYGLRSMHLVQRRARVQHSLCGAYGLRKRVGNLTQLRQHQLDEFSELSARHRRGRRVDRDRPVGALLDLRPALFIVVEQLVLRVGELRDVFE